jgi:hypothetical protein
MCERLRESSAATNRAALLRRRRKFTRWYLLALWYPKLPMKRSRMLDSALDPLVSHLTFSTNQGVTYSLEVRIDALASAPTDSQLAMVSPILRPTVTPEVRADTRSQETSTLASGAHLLYLRLAISDFP